MPAQEGCAQTARMRIYSNAFLAAESGDLDGYELALEQRNNSTVRALLYVYEGAANDDGIQLSGSLSGKMLILQGNWVERLTEYPSHKEIIETHSVRIDGTLDSRWFRGHITIEGMTTPDKVDLKRVGRLWSCKN